MITQKGCELDLLNGVNSSIGENSFRIRSWAHFGKQNGGAYATPQRIFPNSNEYVPHPFLRYREPKIQVLWL